MRWAYTQPLVEKDNRQGELRPDDRAARSSRQDGSRESRALYKAYKKGFEPRLGFAWRPTERWVVRGGYGISQYMEGTGANLRLPLNPPFFFESAVNYDATTGPGTLATGFAELRPLDQPSGQVRAWDPNLRPQFTQQWNVFAEYLLTPSMSAQRRLRRPQRDAPGDAGRRQPAAAGRRRSRRPGCRCRQRRPLFATAPLITNISTTAARGRSDYNGAAGERPAAQREGVRVPGVVHAEPDADQQPRLLRLRRRRRPKARTG